MKKLLFSLLVLLTLLDCNAARCQQYTENLTYDFSLAPASPAHLAFGEYVHVSFKYITSEKAGVYIDILPYSRRVIAQNSQTSRSPLYPSGRGQGTAHFTIHSGNIIIDEIRLEMYDSRNRKRIKVNVIPVHYTFAAEKPPVVVTVQPPQTRSRADRSFYLRQEAAREELRKIINALGPVTPPSGGKKQEVPFVPAAYANLPNAQFYSNELSQQWLDRMNAWIEEMNTVVDQQIRKLLDNSLYDDFKQSENSVCSNDYQKLKFRLSVLSGIVAALTQQ